MNGQYKFLLHGRLLILIACLICRAGTYAQSSFQNLDFESAVNIPTSPGPQGWGQVASTNVVSGGIINYTDILSTNFSNQFYRAVFINQ